MNSYTDITLRQSNDLRYIRLPDIFQFQRNDNAVYLRKFCNKLV